MNRPDDEYELMLTQVLVLIAGLAAGAVALFFAWSEPYVSLP